MRRKKKARKAVIKDKDKDKELILKTKSEWIKNALVNKTKYQKNKGIKPFSGYKTE